MLLEHHGKNIEGNLGPIIFWNCVPFLYKFMEYSYKFNSAAQFYCASETCSKTSFNIKHHNLIPASIRHVTDVHRASAKVFTVLLAPVGGLCLLENIKSSWAGRGVGRRWNGYGEGL